MSVIINFNSVNGYCPDCDLKFGLIRKGGGEIKCPQCKTIICEGINKMIRIGKNSYLCGGCGAKISVDSANKGVPVCHNQQCPSHIVCG